MDIRYEILPDHMQRTARLYIEKGIPGGSFFNAVVSNDLMGAFNKADDANMHAMLDWCMFLYNYAPIGCFGSPENVKEWIASGGLEGLSK